MRLGGESHADSDVLRLAAGVKGRTLRQASACSAPMHACTRLWPCMLFSKHVFARLCVFVCAADACASVRARIHDAAKPQHVTCCVGRWGFETQEGSLALIIR